MKNELKNRYGSKCLVAGAAEGLGSAFFLFLVARGMNLILVDLQEDLLESLARELESSFGIQVKPLHLDLASVDSVELMMEVAHKLGAQIFMEQV